MRPRFIPTPLLLLLCASISTTLADPDLVIRPSAVSSANLPVASSPGSGIGNVRAIEDAPIDGKDGKPHAGPFVETQAERQRKKEKQALSDKGQPAAPDPKSTSAGHVGPDGKVIPPSNDGVMDDKNRLGPKEGTRGTEGGVSAKNKENNQIEGKKPDPPKEAPPLPHSEQEKITTPNDDQKVKDGKKKDKVLEKPEDLPESPHSIPLPKPHVNQKDKELEIDAPIKSPPSEKEGPSPSNDHVNEIIQPLHSFVLSLTMIVFSEIGDKTFLVAALMAMRHPRMVVFSAAYSALIAMTVLSALLGHAVPTILPKYYTNILAAILFLVFGVKMFFEAKNMRPDENVSSEMKEVEMELEEKEHQQRRRQSSVVSPYALEAGHGGSSRKSYSSKNRLPTPDSLSPSSSRDGSPSRKSTFANAVAGLDNLFSFLLSPAWVQTFVMTFLGEWGDRSQIATIAMAAGQDYWWVTWGAMIGHGLCTAAAVIGGRAIAGKVSIRTVTYGGAIAFLVFGFLYVLEVIY